MRRSTSLFPSLLPTVLLWIAAASIAGRASADPRPVLIHNGDAEDTVVTITDENTPNGVLRANQQPLDADADFLVRATPDSNGAYYLHWKAQDTGRTKTEEGDCVAAPDFACYIDIFAAR